jgi:hypothetical protein
MSRCARRHARAETPRGRSARRAPAREAATRWREALTRSRLFRRGSGRSVDPVIHNRFCITSAKFTSAFAPSIVAICTRRPSRASTSRLRDAAPPTMLRTMSTRPAVALHKTDEILGAVIDGAIGAEVPARGAFRLSQPSQHRGAPGVRAGWPWCRSAGYLHARAPCRRASGVRDRRGSSKP